MKAKDKIITFKKTIIEGVEIKRCRKSQQSYKKHLHHELSIGIIESGSTMFEFGKVNHEYLKGDGIIIPPLMSHMCSPYAVDQWQFVMLYIDPKYYQEVLKFDHIVKMDLECTTRLRSFINSVETEVDDGLMEEQLVELLVFLEANTQSNSNVESPIIAHNLYQEIKSFIEEHYTEELSLKMLEEEFRINRFTLIRNFKHLFNTAPMAYQLQLKVAEVKRLLVNNENVFDICNKVGFYDQSHLIKEFKRMNGVSPLVYQNNIKS